MASQKSNLIKLIHYVETKKRAHNDLSEQFIKGMDLSKALTSMKFFLYKQKMLFYHGNGYLWSHGCMNDLYISHRSFYAPTDSF